MNRAANKKITHPSPPLQRCLPSLTPYIHVVSSLTFHCLFSQIVSCCALFLPTTIRTRQRKQGIRLTAHSLRLEKEGREENQPRNQHCPCLFDSTTLSSFDCVSTNYRHSFANSADLSSFWHCSTVPFRTLVLTPSIIPSGNLGSDSLGHFGDPRLCKAEEIACSSASCLRTTLETFGRF